jgi:hypothetical protein
MSEPGSGDGSEVAVITQVILSERQGRDHSWWDQIAAAYWLDSTVRLSWYEGDGAGFVAGSKKHAEHGTTAAHHMFAPAVRVQGNQIHVEVAALMWSTVTVDGTPGNVNSFVRLNYRVERREREWRILSLDPIYEYATLTPGIPGQITEDFRRDGGGSVLAGEDGHDRGFAGTIPAEQPADGFLWHGQRDVIQRGRALE